MSKHALSRIYERYVSVIRVNESPHTLALYPEPPRLERDKRQANYYTPHYIARFFARFVQMTIPGPTFNTIKYIDPACGSGIFLRNLLEAQCDPSSQDVTRSSVEAAFSNAYGRDIDQNAAAAAQLSISLLYLALTSTLPSRLNISATDALSASTFETSPFDVVVANPPYLATDRQDPEQKARISDILGEEAAGRQICICPSLNLQWISLTPGGLGLFVSPHSFLLAISAAPVRHVYRFEHVDTSSRRFIVGARVRGCECIYHISDIPEISSLALPCATEGDYPSM